MDDNGLGGLRKRKIKNNKFMSRAKKKMKEGRYDILDGDTYEYFLKIGETLRTVSSSEKGDICSNVLKETEGKEWDVMSHAMSSRILESIIPDADWADMEGLRESVKDRRSWDGQGCPARVLECLIKDAGRRINNDIPERVECVKFVETKSRLFLNNLESQIWETNANHVTRCCLSTCADTGEERLHEVVRETALYVIAWGQLSDHFSNTLISGFLQIVLAASRKCCPLTADKLLKHLNAVAFAPQAELSSTDGDSLPKIFTVEPLLRLLEAAVMESSEKMYLKLYRKYFKDHLLQLGRSDSYFALIKLISACPDKFIFFVKNRLRVRKVKISDRFDEDVKHVHMSNGEEDCHGILVQDDGHVLKKRNGTSGTGRALEKMARGVEKCGSVEDAKFKFEDIYGVLMESLDEVVGKGHAKIVTALSDKCLGLTTKQGDFIQKLKIWLSCDQKEDKFVQCLLKLRKLPDIEADSKIDMNGSLILQNVFKFNKPIKVVESFLSSDVSELLSIAQDTKGSWVFNSFLSSPSVGDKSRMRLIAKLKGSFSVMAGTKFGSRVFEELWKAAKFKDRLQMIGELDRTILGSQSGRVVAKKIQLDLFLTDKKAWSSKQSNVRTFIE